MDSLYILLLFLGKCSLQECLCTFDRLAGRIFPRPQASNFSLCREVLETLTALFTSGRYDVTVLEACLKEVYGEDQKLFGIGDTKAAVTCLSDANGKLYLLTNYNGDSQRCAIGKAWFSVRYRAAGTDMTQRLRARKTRHS